MVEWIRRSQYLAFINHINSELLQYASLLIMTYSGLRHDWNAGGIDDSSNEIWMTHPSNSSVSPDIRWNSLKEHINGVGSPDELNTFSAAVYHDYDARKEAAQEFINNRIKVIRTR